MYKRTSFEKRKLMLIIIVTLLLFGGFIAHAETIVSESTQTVILKDSDGDGILDESDPHPNVPEIYIVKDDNRNGIVDDFEKK